MAESLNTIKNRRTVRRGWLTTLKRQLDEASEQDLRDIDPAVLDNLKRSIEKESTLHQDLQSRFEEALALEEDKKEDQSTFTREIESGAEHQETYESYLITIDTLIKDYELHKEAERLGQAYEEWFKFADPAARTFLEESKDFIKRFNHYLNCSERRSSSDLIAYSRSQVQSLIGKVHKQVHEIKEKINPSKSEASASDTAGYRSKFDIELPSFHGNPMEWAPFYNLFTTTIEKRGKHLTTEERCCLLLKSLKDQQAKELAQLNTTGEDGYNRATKALIQRYGHSQVILPLHISTLKSPKTFKFNRESLLQLGKHHVTTYRSLKTMKVTLSNFMTAYAASQFDEKLSEEWSKHTATLSALPTMEDLDEYVQSLVCRLPTSSTSTYVSKVNNPNIKLEKQKPKTTNNCILCNDGIHPLAKCPVFKSYSPDKRSKFVREKRWCVNCLHHSHNSQHCTSPFTCRQCSGKHHTLLHRGDSTSSEQTSSPSTTTTVNSLVASSKPLLGKRQCQETDDSVKPPTHAFLSTALVTAINGGRQRISRLALDSGSSTSLITESLASHLRLKRYPHHLAISGAYGDGTSRHYVETTLQSRHDPEQKIKLKLSVVSKLPFATPPIRTEHISADTNVKDLQLADSQFGGKLDILLGHLDSCKCTQGKFRYFPAPDIAVSPTIFGWTVSGPLDLGQTSKFLSLQTSVDDLHSSLQRLWELDQVPNSSQQSSDEELALKQFEDNHLIHQSGRYSVSLPRIVSPPSLGHSKSMAVSHFHQNERTLSKKGRLSEFNNALLEYQTLDHAEIVPKAQLNNTSYYLPVHGVFKETSTTTKVRPVFDASAKTSNGIALNDLLLAGPNLYPLLTDILIQFRVHAIGFSADISKMFREILLNVDERDLHRFLMRDDSGEIKDYRMKRLTFGIKSSPFLATKVLHHLAEKYSTSHPTASRAILRHFYVDDFLSGSETVNEAIKIREELCQLLKLAGMNLRKWRTSNKEFASSIPDSLLESEQLTLSEAPKALGIHWETQQDALQVSTPSISPTQLITKRSIASNAAKVYDILGLFSPFVIRSKILLQQMWKANCDWDDEAPNEIKLLWSEWASELPLIHQHSINRRYDTNTSPVLQRSLHGFSDASITAYGAVIYLRQLHEDGSISVSLVISKARVAPLKTITIPRAELVAAHLLSQLLVYSAKLLDIPTSNLHAWTDSTIVLCWIRKSPSSLQTFVANRISNIQQTITDTQWRHVSTKENPADLLSRGVSASTLLNSSLWWVGPSWLSQPPNQWSSQQHLASALPKQPPERRVVTLTAVVNIKEPDEDLDLWSRYSSFITLTRILAWIRRFLHNLKRPVDQRARFQQLQSEELKSAKIFILDVIQQQSYPSLTSTLKNGKQLPNKHPLSKFNVSLNPDKLLTVSGRVRQPGSREPKQAIALSLKSPLAKLLVATEHKANNHPGVSALMAILTESYYIAGLRNQLKLLSRTCSICQRAYGQSLQPPMGMLPSARTTPTPPFQVTGIDFAGPFTIRKGHTRKPVLVKSYVCLFVCFATRAVHLELCADLSTEEFIAALRRFCARRGTPTDIHSDNGTNFVGAASELKQVQHLLNSSKAAISHLVSSANIQWHFIPPRSPNFGGLWEAGIKQVKILMRKLLTPHPLRFEELYTILVEIEAILNSRPIIPLDSTELDNDLVLTPGHFLIWRPLKAPARRQASEANLSSLRRWNLVQRLQQDLWISWQAWYLNTLDSRSKWNRQSRTLHVGDVVLIKDENLTTHLNWPLAKIVQLYQGDDGISRAADLLCHGKVYKRAINRIIPIHQPDNFPTTTATSS